MCKSEKELLRPSEMKGNQERGRRLGEEGSSRKKAVASGVDQQRSEEVMLTEH